MLDWAELVAVSVTAETFGGASGKHNADIFCASESRERPIDYERQLQNKQKELVFIDNLVGRLKLTASHCDLHTNAPYVLE